MKDTLATLLALLVWAVALVGGVCLLAFVLYAFVAAPSFWGALSLIGLIIIAKALYDNYWKK